MSSSLSSSSSPTSPPDADRADEHTSHGATFGTRWPEPNCVLITARGDLDAANSNDFVDWALQHSDRASRLVLDLSGVEFFGTAAFSALHTFNVRCAGARADWLMVPGPAVLRLLRICDPDAMFPLCADVDSALAWMRGETPRLLQLVAEPR
jgi:anti-anti-sigma factor